MSAFHDVRLAFRLFRRNPVSTGIALLSIALSVGAASVVFAAIKSVLLDPLPYARPDELVQFRSEFPGMAEQSHGDWVTFNDTLELARRTRALESIGVSRNAVFDLAGDPNTTPQALYGVLINADLFPVLGVSPMLGRNFLAEEDQPGHADVMILSFGLWTSRFHSDRSVVGRTVTVNGRACLIVGVMPPGFNYPMRRPATRSPAPYVEFWATPFVAGKFPSAAITAVARLRPGVSLEQTRQDLDSISRALTHDFPALNRDRILKLNRVRDQAVGSAARGLWLLMAAAILFMFIGCANVANLLLARGFARQREMAIRMAIGAGRGRIVRQLLTESCALAALGGVGGYLFTAIAWEILPSIAPVSIPRLAAARADESILAFALALALINGVLFGIAPALRMAQWNRATRYGRHDRVRSGLVTAEVAISVLLVVVGAQVLSGFVRLVATDPGFEADRVLASIVLPAPARYPDPEQRGLFYQRILNAVRALPGVEGAGTTDALPFSGENHGGFVTNGNVTWTAEVDVIGGDYLQTMGIRLVEGRWFRDDEMSASNDAAIVNTLVAARLWPGGSAIGQRVCVFCTPENPNNWKRVIGVVTIARHAALDQPQGGAVYLAAGAMQSSVFIVVRTKTFGQEMRGAISRAIAAIDPNQPVLLSASLGELIADSVADRRFIMMLLAATGSLALVLAAAGVYGVISYITSRRTHEIGIRMAIGATPGQVLSLVFRQGFLAVALGLAAGLAGALVSIRFLRLESGHSGGIWIAAMLVTIAAALACWIPARRAAATDPMAALRQE
jgi:putative ABC transport system permease protein